jgi:hypothetical protein
MTTRKHLTPPSLQDCQCLTAGRESVVLRDFLCSRAISSDIHRQHPLAVAATTAFKEFKESGQ